MGGLGSGGHHHGHVKNITDDYRSIDVRRWKRDGLLNPHTRFIWQWACHGEVTASILVYTEQDRVIVSYRHCVHNADGKTERYPIPIEWTNCNFGGQRPWFLCPIRGCGRRVAILYGGNLFACRHCYQLSYASQRETWDERAARRADRIKVKLGWKPGILNPKGWLKPKGMHWSTFERLNTEHDAFVQKSLCGLDERLSLLGLSLNGRI